MISRWCGSTSGILRRGKSRKSLSGLLGTEDRGGAFLNAISTRFLSLLDLVRGPYDAKSPSLHKLSLVSRAGLASYPAALMQEFHFPQSRLIVPNRMYPPYLTPHRPLFQCCERLVSDGIHVVPLKAVTIALPTDGRVDSCRSIPISQTMSARGG